MVTKRDSKDSEPRFDAERYKEREKQVSIRAGFGRLQDGRTNLRVFLFEHKVTESDFDRGVYSRKGKHPEPGERVLELDRQVNVHFLDDGQVNCPGAKCEHCAESRELMSSKGKAEKKLGRSIGVRKQYYVNAVDTDNPEAGMQLWPLPTTVYTDILSHLNNGDYSAKDLFGPKGRDFTVVRDSTKSPAKMYRVSLRDKEKCEELPEELQDSVQDLNANESLDPGESRGGGGGSGGGSSRRRDDEDEEKDKDEEKPKSRRRDEEEEEEKPKNRRRDEEEEKDKDEDDKPARRRKDDEDEEKEKAKDEDKPDADDFVGKRVKFKAEGKTIRGKAKSVNKDGVLLVIDDKGDEWDIEAGDLELID